MGKHHLVGGIIQDFGRIGHEGHLACGSLNGEHGEQRLLVTLATGGDALLVEQCQRHAARGAGCGNQVKTVEGESIQAVTLHDALDRAVEAHRLDDFVARGFLDAHGLVDELVGNVLYLVVGNSLIALDHLVEWHIDHLNAPTLTHGGIVHIAGDEPSRGLADDAHALAVQLGQGLVGCSIIVDALHDETDGTVQNAAVAVIEPHPRQYLQRCGERVLQSVGNEHDIGWQAVDVGFDHLLHTATAHEHHRGTLGHDAVKFLGENVLHVIFLADGVEQFVMVGEN